MSIKYYAWLGRIERIEIIKESAKTVTLKSGISGERRSAKLSEDRGYFDTYQEAKQFLIDQATADLKQLYDQVDRLETKLAKIKEMQEQKHDQ